MSASSSVDIPLHSSFIIKNTFRQCQVTSGGGMGKPCHVENHWSRVKKICVLCKGLKTALKGVTMYFLVTESTLETKGDNV